MGVGEGRGGRVGKAGSSDCVMGHPPSPNENHGGLRLQFSSRTELGKPTTTFIRTNMNGQFMGQI
jgi:hypothetical protein